MAEGTIAITISNWDKFNPRADRGNYSWFKLQNTYFMDQAIFGLPSSAKLVFIFLCCEASRHNKGQIAVRIDYASMMTGLNASEIATCIEQLHALNLLQRKSARAGIRSRFDLVAKRREEERREEEKREEEKRGESPSSGDDTPAVCLFTIWNENCGTLPKAGKFSDKRKKHAANRLKENPDFEYWLSVVQQLAASRFCCGANDRGWVASFDFLLQPDTHVKVTEGKYDNRQGTPKTRQQAMSDANAQMLIDIEEGRL